MKHIYLNLKRFDILKEFGGVNGISPPHQWGEFIVNNTQEALGNYSKEEVQFKMYMPEAHLIGAIQSLKPEANLEIGCQSVFYDDSFIGGNFGAFTTSRTANSMQSIGCSSTIIGHCEERRDKAAIMQEAGVTDAAAVNRILNKEIKRATEAGMKVLYCIGESAEEQDNWQEVLKNQLRIGLENLNNGEVVIAYEPIWAIGPGKTPPDRHYIEKIAKFIKKETDGLPVIYGGGLKVDNAKMLSSIPEVDGGLIALTRFQGDIGFYPEEYLEIIATYLGK